MLVVDTADHVRDLTAVLGCQPLDLHVVHDPADALFVVGRTSPDVVLLAPVAGRLSAVSALEVLRTHEPRLPVVVGVGPSDGAWAGRATALAPAALVAHPFRAESVVTLLQSLAPTHLDFAPWPLPLDFGRLRIEGAAPGIWLDGVRTTLPLREFLLLRFLAEHAGSVISRAAIVEAVWGSAGAEGSNTVAVHVMRLRRRLGDRDEGPHWITAVRGLGYQFNVPAQHRSTR